MASSVLRRRCLALLSADCGRSAASSCPDCLRILSEIPAEAEGSTKSSGDQTSSTGVTKTNHQKDQQKSLCHILSRIYSRLSSDQNRIKQGFTKIKKGLGFLLSSQRRSTDVVFLVVGGWVSDCVTA